MTTPITLETLRSFCSKDPYRPRLEVPFNAGNYTYATDGKVMIRVPRIEEFDSNVSPNGFQESVVPNREGLVPAEFPPEWEKIQDDSKTCQICDGSGQLAECPKCNGEGVKECHECGHEESCRECDSTGRVEVRYAKNDARYTCGDCEGEGVIVIHKTIFLNRGIAPVNLRRLRKVMKLPGARLFVGSRDQFVRIEFEGGDGVLSTNISRDTDQRDVAEQWRDAP